MTLLLDPPVSGSGTQPSGRDEPRASFSAIRREIDSDNICHLIFDQPGSSANVFSLATLRELEAHVAWIATAKGLRGVILRSAKSAIFIAGADLKTLSRTDSAELGEVLRLGQRVFSAFAALRVKKIAAIHGACLGGGFELALCCDFRTASAHPATKIGLPETQLGIVPAWGGSTRLPRLIGVENALRVILKGSALPARQALKRGLVDEVVAHGCVAERARRLLRGEAPWPVLRRPSALMERFKSPVIRRFAWEKLRAETRGHYPAQKAALELVTRALERSVDDSLAAEREAFTSLISQKTARHLLHLFFAKERAKHSGGSRDASAASANAPSLNHVTVAGAGVMGSGIAYWLAARGKRVQLLDVNDAALAKAARRLADSFREARQRGLLTAHEEMAARDRLLLARATEVSLARTDLVIEAAVEDADVKRQLFADMLPRLRPDAVLATNTSAIPVGSLSDDPRVIGLHFFNPVAAMPLVEIVRPANARPEAIAAALRFVKDIGKTPLLVKDSPGFLVNRVLLPYLLEAARLTHEGLPATVIDEAMRDFGMPMGPLRLLDEIGLDVALHAAETIAAQFPERVRIPAFLYAWTQENRLGVKTGHGFYRHADKAAPPKEPAPAAMRDGSDLAERLALLLANEAARCLDEGIVENAEAADLGMVLGTGFAPFRGGPLHYAEDLGMEMAASRLRQLAQLHGPLYEPAPLLSELAAAGRSFFSDSPERDAGLPPAPVEQGGRNAAKPIGGESAAAAAS